MTQAFTSPKKTGSGATYAVRRPGSDRHTGWNETHESVVSAAGLATARATIAGWPGYAESAQHHLPGLAARLGVADISLKDESTRFGLGSFKALGGAYAVARLLQRRAGETLGRAVAMEEITSRALPEIAEATTVCCATDGNHGRSVAWGARNFGCRCVIFIHATVSEGRKSAIEAYGAEVRRCAGNYDDSVREAQATADQEGWFVVSDTSYPGYMEIPKDVMQGYELMADEAFSDLSTPPTHIFLQTGVGGMAAAVTANAVRRWGEGRPAVVLCDPDRAACWLDSLVAGRPVAVDGDLDTLMAGLACGEVSALAWQILSDFTDAVIALPDSSAIEAMKLVADPAAGDPPVVAGESAVAGLAGLIAAVADNDLKAALGLDGTSRIALFSTEGDTDAELYRDLVGRSAAEVLSGSVG